MITDELREWAEDTLMRLSAHEDLLAIADRIEAALAERYIKLPKDADGEYIHFGDVLDQFGTPMTVFAMSDPDPDQGDCMLELITDGISDSTWVRARKMRHHHEPTVEATLGRGECKVDVLNTGDCAGYECSEYIMHCNACGHEFGHVLYNEDGDVWMSEPPRFCPNCGRRVVGGINWR